MFSVIKNNIYKFQIYHNSGLIYGYNFSVVCGRDGFSKGYGFISFYSVEEQKHCLNNMNGFLGIGSKPIKVSSVIQKSKAHIAV